ncbi:NF-kappa-B essential modulator isoform X1 [Athalia rosae]|uniref:NF-kappa-B essential modulator isoform X1 n=1 Tax=Athalia rosae TaxID=37344 RepID=UPI00203323CF|nr:NF-kappa-B essential modulator isoform X1 [Athalia rosae]
MASFQQQCEPSRSTVSMDSIEPASLLEANIRAGITDENHLRSLGFIMNDGRPRFKIDEPVGNGVNSNTLGSGFNAIRSTSNSIDPDDESFVVLGKDSLSSIRASSLASLAQIQQKSSTADYNSVISSLTAEETEKKLKELLQENIKLKETLQQNNLAMKQQFNTIAAWQEEISKVHQSHKQKFSETKELINQLKKENSDLKMKAFQGSGTSTDLDLKVRDLEAKLTESVEAQNLVQSARELELQELNSKLSKELADSKLACGVLTADVQRHMALSTRLCQQLKQADVTIEGLKLDVEKLELNLKEKEELSSLADFSLIAMTSKQAQASDMGKEKAQEREEENKRLRELISSLEQQLNVTCQTSLPPIEIQTANPRNQALSEDHLQFLQNVKQYNDILQRVSECWGQQGTRHITVQESLQEAIGILQDLEKARGNEQVFVEKQDKLVTCRVRLNDERLQMMNERQEMIKAQSQFQKVFSDYNSVLYELEIMHEENAKLSCSQNKNIEVSVEEHVLRKSPVNKNEDSARNKKLIEEANTDILSGTITLAKEIEAKNALQTECSSLGQTLAQLKIAKEAEQQRFLAEKKHLQKVVQELEAKNKNLEESLKLNAEVVDRLQRDIASLKKQNERIPHIEAQVQIYEEDFKEEREARQRSVQEKEKLLTELKNLQKLHMDLVATLQGQRASAPHLQQQSQQQQSQWQSLSRPEFQTERDSEVSVSTPVITAFSCPKCSLSFKAMRPLQEHVEACLELQ